MLGSANPTISVSEHSDEPTSHPVDEDGKPYRELHVTDLKGNSIPYVTGQATDVFSDTRSAGSG